MRRFGTKRFFGASRTNRCTDDDHTGAPASSQGFVWRAVYPTCEQMSEAADKLGRGRAGLPAFPGVRVDDPVLLGSFNELHSASRERASALARETLLVRFLSLLITRHASPPGSRERKREGWVVRKARRFFLENLSQHLTLGEVARHLGIDRFRLIREFNQELGLPPHSYLDCLRVRQAQRLLASGRPSAPGPCKTSRATPASDSARLTTRLPVSLSPRVITDSSNTATGMIAAISDALVAVVYFTPKFSKTK